jgi:hypothetical protein
MGKAYVNRLGLTRGSIFKSESDASVLAPTARRQRQRTPLMTQGARVTSPSMEKVLKNSGALI